MKNIGYRALRRLHPRWKLQGSCTRTKVTSYSTLMTAKTDCAHLADHEAPMIMLTAKPYFDQLERQEKLYAHYMSKAAFAGTRVTLRQVSHESEAIFDLVLLIHGKVRGEYGDSEDAKYYLEYVSQFLNNLGNFNSFGDSKFVPRCSKEYFYALLKAAEVDRRSKPATASCVFGTYEQLIEEGVYSVNAWNGLLGYPSEGHTSAYYFGPVCEADMCMLKEHVFGAEGILPENTRIRKLESGDFEILVASAESTGCHGYPCEPLELPNGNKVSFKFGDHAREMKLIAAHLTEAKRYACNDTQRAMLDAHIDAYLSGNMQSYKKSQEHWVKDLSPAVETNIGFVETYREPSGIIGEFEALVAVTNKERTRTFKKLVDSAPEFIPLLPWGPEFEKPEFQPPDFTSLEVLTFSGSGIPSGINIPNFDDVRVNIGFKNVSLGNIVNAIPKTTKNTFLSDQDSALFSQYQAQAFEVQVGIHELLGHGSGKLLCELPDGSFNFDMEKPLLGLDGKPVQTYYKKGETWSSKFGQISGAYEECRAEAVAMYLVTNRDLLNIFGFTTPEEQNRIIYISFLQMARAGLLALDFWDANSNKWGQAHMQARFAIMNTFLNHVSNKEFLKFNYSQPDYSDLTIQLREDLIETVGHECIGEFLKHLHVFKTVGDVEEGTKYFSNRSSVTPDLAKFKTIVGKKRLPRRQFIQANTVVRGDEVELHEYEPTPLGIIRSFVEREV